MKSEALAAARPLSFLRRVAQVVTIACLFAHAGVQAAELRWANRPFQIVANEKPLPDFLRELASSQGVTSVIDSKINGVISGRFAGSAQAVLDNVCSVNGLTWYFDGAFLFIDLASDAVSDVMPIASENAGRIAQTLVDLRISDARYPLRISERDSSVYVTGPKRYVEMVRQAVRLADQKSAMGDGAEIRVFPLKYAWAADFRVNRSGRETVIAGVANVLRSLFNTNRGASQAIATTGASTGNGTGGTSINMNRQIKLGSGESVNAPKVSFGGLGGVVDGSSLGSSGNWGSAELPQFQADTRMNAVLIRDTPDRMHRYAKLIESMDVRPRVIEIELTIMDISSDNLTSLGIDWRLHGSHLDVQTGRGDRSALTWDSATTEAGQVARNGLQGNPITPLGSMITAAIGNSARNYLLARVTALATNGDANFVARPKVLTLDNTEAVLENLSEFYVRVDGFQDSSLYNVSAGTTVRITPLIIDERTGRGVMMSVDIVDGDISAQSVDRIPIVRRRTVNTQALVEEGTSLLIAGYTSEERNNLVSGVPFLKDIPGIGAIFRYTDNKQVNMERFYLLTPRLVTAATPPTMPSMPALPVPAPAVPQVN